MGNTWFTGLLILVLVVMITLALYLNKSSKRLEEKLEEKDKVIRGLTQTLSDNDMLISTSCECWMCDAFNIGAHPCQTPIAMPQVAYVRYDRAGYVVLSTSCPNFRKFTQGKDLKYAPKGDGWLVLEPEGI